MRSAWQRLSATIVVLVAGLLGVTACSATATQPAPTVTVTHTVTAAPSASSTTSASPGATGATPASPSDSQLPPAAATTDLRTMTVSQLPPEAQTLLPLIAAGGPFEYSQDGQTFQNREGILPPQSYGFYREYTVETPGSPDRGARRFVVGENGAVFYTQDHYRSFSEVIR